MRPDDDAIITPDFIADETDPLWRFADAATHRACFLVWERRKSFVARYNVLARRWVAPDGSEWRMTSEGDLVRRSQPPAMAPTTSRGSAPFTTASGRGASGGSWDRSCSQAKNRTKGRRRCVT